MARDAQGPHKARASGQVRFPPFEDLDEVALQGILKFHVRPFPGLIRDNARRIPYNSGKKDFSQKTNRDSFQVFQYEFRLPGEEQVVYTVLWDYNIGLVRMTPFFKCCRYSKTTPAKMLNQNPGLRDITHSITGGAITAQGYWMPYDCAKAVCATFCCDIAPALIPLFGPSFPSECIPRLSPSHGRMVIDPKIIATSSRQAHMFRQMNATPTPTPTSAPTTPLNHHHHLLPSPYHHHHHSADDTPDTDVDMYSPLSASSRLRYLPAPAPLRTANTSDWTPPVNNNNTAQGQAEAYHPAQGQGHYYSDHQQQQIYHHSRPATPGGASPWLSALPSRGGDVGGGGSYYPLPAAAHAQGQGQARYHPHAAAPGPLRPHYLQQQHRYDDGYDAGESMNGGNSSPERERDCDEISGGAGGREQDAAMVLLGLRTSPPAVVEEGDGQGRQTQGTQERVRRGKSGRGVPSVGRGGGGGEDAPKVKRRRATLV